MLISPFMTEASDLRVIEHLVAGEALVPAQLPRPDGWSPERRLAGAVLAGALVEVRDHLGQSGYRRAVAQDLDWIFSDDTRWPFSFVPLCHLVALDPEYVRAMVCRWVFAEESTASRSRCRHRDGGAPDAGEPTGRGMRALRVPYHPRVSAAAGAYGSPRSSLRARVRPQTRREPK